MSYPEPNVIQIDGLTVAGLSVRTINRDEFNPDTAKLPQLWERFLSGSIMEKIPGRRSETTVYGVYSDYDSDASGFYTVTAGVAVDSSSEGELQTVSIQPGRYLVFADKGAMPQVVIKIWERIWNYFGENTVYKRRFISDFEVYLNGKEVAVYIGIEN